MHTTDPNKNRNFYVKSDNVEIRPGSNINDVLIKLLGSFLDNYGKEEQILRNGSNTPQFIQIILKTAIVFNMR